MTFQQYKYKFSTKASINVVSEDITEKREEEINRLKEDLIEYKILIKDLVYDKPSYDIRNKILNISYFIIENIEIYDYLIKNKEFPLKLLLENTPLERTFLEQWKEFIITYSIILSDPTYHYLQDYLQIVEAIQVLGSEEIFENKEVEEHRGLLLHKGKFSSVILSSKGEFIKVKSNKEEKIGEEILAKESISLKKYKTQIAIFFSLIGFIFLIASYKYNNIDKTLVIEITSTITLELNSSNKVVNYSSNSEEIKEILKELKIKNNHVDSVLINILDYASNNEMIPSTGIVLKVTGEALEDRDIKNTEEYIAENKLEVKFNNSGDENKVSE